MLHTILITKIAKILPKDFMYKKAILSWMTQIWTKADLRKDKLIYLQYSTKITTLILRRKVENKKKVSLQYYMIYK